MLYLLLRFREFLVNPSIESENWNRQKIIILYLQKFFKSLTKIIVKLVLKTHEILASDRILTNF